MKHIRFEQFHKSVPANRDDWFAPEVLVVPEGMEGVGWYYTTYNAETGESTGWFGSEEEPQYWFENALVPEYAIQGGDPESEDLFLASRNCGVGEGCFWTEWR